MVAGTIVMEGLTLHFQMVFNSRQVVNYTICDGLTGECEHVFDVSAPDFMVALGIALNFEGDVPPNRGDAWAQAESVQPGNPMLRFIP